MVVAPLLLLVLSCSASAQKAPVSKRAHTLTGTFKTHPDFLSRFLKTPRTVVVYLPPDYNDPKNTARRYPVLYLQDGQNLFDGATSFLPGKEWHVDEAAESLIRKGEVEPLIIVGVYNAGAERIFEYTPTKDARIGAGGRADTYGHFLVDELKPFIDRTYRTKTDAESTGIGGSSLGGLVSLYLGLKYPAVFHRLAILSPSVWWNNRSILQLVAQTPTGETQPALRLWLDIGTREGEQPTETLSDARALRDALVAKGWTVGKDLQYTEVEGAEHNEDAWSSRFPAVLKFLFPSK